LEGSDLQSAAQHLERAAAGFTARGEAGSLAQIKFELGSISAQQGNLARAVSLYQEALASAELDGTEQGLTYQILARNNLAYHLLLMEDNRAEQYVQDGLALAREKGVIGLLPYLLSTRGEILLSRGEFDAAQASFQEGLDLAERLPIPERIAGLEANLGLVASRRGQTSLAIHYLSTALAQANALGTHHLAVQIRLWLAPLLPRPEGKAVLREARALAESSGRRRLLAELEDLEAALKD
jgi:tetratricopeptide (TPR) repeat protein